MKYLIYMLWNISVVKPFCSILFFLCFIAQNSRLPKNIVSRQNTKARCCFHFCELNIKKIAVIMLYYNNNYGYVQYIIILYYCIYSSSNDVYIYSMNFSENNVLNIPTVGKEPCNNNKKTTSKTLK
jgi:hypothetical protein